MNVWSTANGVCLRTLYTDVRGMYTSTQTSTCMHLNLNVCYFLAGVRCIQACTSLGVIFVSGFRHVLWSAVWCGHTTTVYLHTTTVYRHHCIVSSLLLNLNTSTCEKHTHNAISFIQLHICLHFCDSHFLCADPSMLAAKHSPPGT